MFIVSLAGCTIRSDVCVTVWLPCTSGGLCVQKGTGKIIQVLVHWLWDVKDLEAAAGLNL